MVEDERWLDSASWVEVPALFARFMLHLLCHPSSKEGERLCSPRDSWFPVIRPFHCMLLWLFAGALRALGVG